MVSEALTTLASGLLRVADSSNNRLCTVDQVSRRKDELRTLGEKLHNARLELATATTKVSDVERETIAVIIKALEGVKYGSVARSVAAETGYFATVAEGLDEKLK